MKILADTDNSLYLKADMFADTFICRFVYTFWEPYKNKKKVSSLKATSQTLQHKQPSLNSEV